MNRKNFIHQSSFAAASFFIPLPDAQKSNAYPVVRIPASQRKFTSQAVEKRITRLQANIANKEIGWLFGNCFPNTLDTTVSFEVINGKADTFVITGDIDAMWLRDSSAQVWPYLPLMKEDKNLRELIKGVINRHVICILRDPYANAFYKDENKVSEWKNDKTTMKPGIHERKWEVDSLCYCIRLSYEYWKETGDLSLFDSDWKEAMRLVVQTFREQQRISGEGPYRFQRETTNPTDSVPNDGFGNPTKKVGLIHSMFRPSDDATIFPFNIPGNLFAEKSLRQLEEIYGELHISRSLVAVMAEELKHGLEKYSIVKHPQFQDIYAYEVDGFGGINLMDDSNVPSLLSLPYLNIFDKEQLIYKNTRQFVLSNSNPYFFKGKSAEGVGGPHVGMDYIWPMSIAIRGLTSIDDKEVKYCLDILQATHAGKGFIHESFHKDNPEKFTRSWFAWANTLFGEFVWGVFEKQPYLLS